MAESLNKNVEYVCNGTFFLGIQQYGRIMTGDKAFEFYDDRNVENYVQIPWEEITYIVADVMLGGKWIPRFEVQTKKNGSFRFSAGKNTKPLLRSCGEHMPKEHLVRAYSFGQKIIRGLKRK
ncbi:MAG: DUF956 family protein [Eubacteriales bacterium]|nr:DUF956 family protein [Eubacteriales bacterium]